MHAAFDASARSTIKGHCECYSAIRWETRHMGASTLWSRRGCHSRAAARDQGGGLDLHRTLSAHVICDCGWLSSVPRKEIAMRLRIFVLTAVLVAALSA